MDQAQMMQLILQSYGAAPTPENEARIRNFYASNPDAMERRAMGLRGGIREDNTDILQLDKAIDATMAPASGAIQQEALPPLETVQNATGRTRETATAAPTAATAQPPRGPSMQPEFNNPQFQDVNAPQEVPEGGFDIGKFLLSVLGASSLAGRGAMNPAPRLPAPAGQSGVPDGGHGIPSLTNMAPDDPNLIQGPDPNAPRLPAPPPRLEEGGANARANRTSTVQEDPTLAEAGRRAQLQAEIDAENRQAQMLQDQIMQRHLEQQRTRQLIESARRVTGRR